MEDRTGAWRCTLGRREWEVELIGLIVRHAIEQQTRFGIDGSWLRIDVDGVVRLEDADQTLCPVDDHVDVTLRII